MGLRRLVVGAAFCTIAVSPIDAVAADGGQAVDIGDGRVCTSSARVEKGQTVIFESGSPNDGTVWQKGASSGPSAVSRACIYDRPGTATGDHLSRSAAAPRRALPATSSPTSHTMLRVGGAGPVRVRRPLHRRAVRRLYATSYPDETAGLVLVDAGHEDRVDELQPILPPDLVEPILFGLSTCRPTCTSYPQVERISSSRGRPGPAPPLPLRPMPLVVLTHGIPVSAENPVPPDFPSIKFEAVLSQLQRRLTDLVPGGRQVIAAHSGHYIPARRADLVIDATRAVVDAVRPATRSPVSELPADRAQGCSSSAGLASATLAVGVTLRKAAQPPRRSGPRSTLRTHG